MSKTGRTLNAREAHELRRLLAEEQPALAEQVLGAVTFNGCPVRIDRTKPYTCTTDVNVTLENGAVVVKPVTRTLRVGTVLKALPIVNADREGLSLEITVDHAVLAGASMQTVRVGPPGEETEFVLQTPFVNATHTTTVVDLTKSGMLVLPLGAVATEARHEFGPPVLSRIPYVNRLFRNIGYGRESRLLYVMVTPQIHGR
jgi:type II secretory pathway component GspD/PulD (secretin)